MPDRLPWMKFEPRSWMTEPGLRVCSLAARGLWTDMLCLMWDSPDRGRLIIAERAPSTAMIARLVGTTEQEVESLLAELDESGVLSRDDNGAIYSRRMVREEHDRSGIRTRVANHRKRKSEDGNASGNGECNGDVTPQSKKKSKSKRKNEDEKNAGAGIGANPGGNHGSANAHALDIECSFADAGVSTEPEAVGNFDLGQGPRPPAAEKPQPEDPELIESNGAARAAFDAWKRSPPTVGGKACPLNCAENEHAPIHAAVARMARMSPVAGANGPQRREGLVPRAVEALRARGTQFKNPKFAAACVEREIADWADAGIPDPSKANGRKRPDPPSPYRAKGKVPRHLEDN